MYKLVGYVLLLSAIACVSTGIEAPKESWEPGEESEARIEDLENDKKSCKYKIQDARRQGFDTQMSRNAYYHCMESRGWMTKSH